MSFNEIFPGVYSVPQDAVLNPARGASIAVFRGVGSPKLQVLPAAPAGTMWAVFNGNVIAAAATSWSITEEIPGEAVRPVDVRPAAAAGSFIQAGSIFTPGPLMLENTGAGAIQWMATATLVPSTLIQRFSMSLTAAFAAVPYTAPPEGAVLRVPFGGYNQGSNAPLWINNTDVAARTVEWRFTRAAAGVLFTVQNIATNAGTRVVLSGVGASAWPPLQAGDVWEARVTAAPGAPVYFGGALQLVPATNISPE